MDMLKAFEEYCKKEGITSEQYMVDIWPVWEAAYTAGFASKSK